MYKRQFYLDNLKTFALLLGILFHTSIVYATNIGYVIKNGDLNYFFSILVHCIHVFRMPLFFFLSGFFSFMVLHNKGGRIYTFSRVERMLAPMFVGIFIFAPVQYYIIYNQTHEPISFLKYYLKFLSSEEFDYSHIWFLVYLFIYSFLLITNHKLKLIEKLFLYSGFGFEQVLKKINSHLEKILLGHNFLFIKAISLCFTFIFIANIFFNKDYSFFRIKPVSFFYYLAFFISGVIAYKKGYLQDFSLASIKDDNKSTFRNAIQLTPSFALTLFKMGNRNSISLCSKSFSTSCGFLLLLTAYLYFDEFDPFWMDFTYEWNKILIRGLHLLIECILAWSCIFLLLRAFKVYLDRSRPTLDYLRNSGMSIYLIHHPISLLLGDYFLKIKISLFLKFCLHTSLVYILSFFFYQYIIKKSFILKSVFGTK